MFCYETKTPAGQRCHWCDRVMARPGDTKNPLAATRDHVHPRARGGWEGRSNTVWSCGDCNHIKGDMTLDVWVEFMKTNPFWWLLSRRSTQSGVRLRAAQALQEAGIWGGKRVSVDNN